MSINKRSFILSKFTSVNMSFVLSTLASLKIPEDYASSKGNHEAVRVLKEYAEVCVRVVMKGSLLNLDAFLHLLLLNYALYSR